jgi:hypothetical protein
MKFGGAWPLAAALVTGVPGCGDTDEGGKGQSTTMVAAEPSDGNSSMNGSTEPDATQGAARVPNVSSSQALDAGPEQLPVASAAVSIAATGGRCDIGGALIMIPKGSPDIGRASSSSTESALRSMDTVQDGVNGASVDCGATETSLNLRVNDASHDTFDLTVTLNDREGMDGRVTFVGPLTGGTEFTASGCAVRIERTLDDGASVLAYYNCPELTSASSPQIVCEAVGYLWITHCG